jgi:hypothetical protein
LFRAARGGALCRFVLASSRERCIEERELHAATMPLNVKSVNSMRDGKACFKGTSVASNGSRLIALLDKKKESRSAEFPALARLHFAPDY